MKLIRTAKIKLNVSASEVLPTIQAYTNAFNFVCQVGYSRKITNGISLHKLTYYEVRNQFDLPSQLAISARMKAKEAVKSALTKTKYKKIGSCPTSKQCSIRLDANSYSLFLDKNKVSILTISGRKKYELIIPDYYKNQFANWEYGSADLCVKKNKVYLHISFELEIPDIVPDGNVYGLDRGISKLAVVSNNKFFGSSKLKQQVKKYQRIRSKLQKCGSKSAKRHLRQLSGKEKRFRADINHCISKEIISSLNPGDTLALEDLKGIRKNKARKKVRTMLNSWSFFQLEQFLIYKAAEKGVHIEFINPAYTSQMCSCCGYTDKFSRKDQANFCCTSCGFRLNADLNASRNIRNKHLISYMPIGQAVVNQPIAVVETLTASSCL